MLIKQLLISSLATFCASCAFFERPPPPEPIWAAVLPKWEQASTGVEELERLTPSIAQKIATERARAYVDQSLPASYGSFTRNLKEQRFFCTVRDEITVCTYSQAHRPFPCFGATRVSVVISLPYRSVYPETAAVNLYRNEVDVTAMATDAPGHRGPGVCLAL